MSKDESKSQPLLIDSFYIPRWSQTRLGLEPSTAFYQLSQVNFADRAAPHMRYRGNMLKRSKFFLVDSLEQVPIYLYPGFQYGSIVAEYGLIQEQPLITRFCDALAKEFKASINHVIGTKYEDGRDGIGYHNDKPKTLDPATPIFIYSCGQQRPLSFRPIDPDEDEELEIIEAPMEPGSLLVLGWQTNLAYQHSIQEDDSEGQRISLVLRNVLHRVPMKTVELKAALTERRRNAKKDKDESADE